jgi:hypothetical protein
VANAALLKVAQELQNQAVNQDLVKRIDPRLGQKDQVTVTHLLSAVLNAVKARTGVLADLVLIVAREEHQQNALTPNVVMMEVNQEKEDHQRVLTEEVMTDARVGLAAKVATDVNQPAHTANALKAVVKTGVQVNLVVIAVREELQQNALTPSVVKMEENQEKGAHQPVRTANVQKLEMKIDAQVDLVTIETIEDHHLAVKVTKEVAALIEKNITIADHHVQPENRVVRTWLKELKLAI